MKYTKEQVSEWKAKWGELFEISVEGKSCILHKPKPAIYTPGRKEQVRRHGYRWGT